MKIKARKKIKAGAQERAQRDLGGQKVLHKHSRKARKGCRVQSQGSQSEAGGLLEENSTLTIAIQH